MNFSNKFKALLVSVALTLSACYPFLNSFVTRATLNISLNDSNQKSIQVFCNAGRGFNEADAINTLLPPAFNGSQDVSVTLKQKCRAIRIDFENQPNTIEVRYAAITSSTGETVDIYNTFISTASSNDVSMADSSKAIFQIHGDDPWVLLNGNFDQLTEPTYHYMGFAALALAYLAGFFMLFDMIKPINRVVSNNLALCLTLGIAFFLRLRYWVDSALPSTVETLGQVWPDEATYFGVSKHILNHGFLSYLTSTDSIIVAPGNPSYLALLFTIFHSIDAIRFINLVLSTVTLFWVYRIGERLFSKRVGLLAAIACALNGQLIEYSATLLTEPLFIFCLIGFTYNLIEYIKPDKDSHVRHAVSACLFLTFGTLTRSILLLYPIALVLVLIYLAITLPKSIQHYDLNRQRLKFLVLCLLILTLTLSCVAYKNQYFFNRFAIATGSGAALWLGSRADSEGDEPPYRGLKYNTHSVTKHYSHISPEGDKLLTEAAKSQIANDPITYLINCAKKPFRLLIGNNYAWFYPQKNIYNWYRGNGESINSLIEKLANILGTTLIVIFGLLGCLSKRREPVTFTTLIAPIAYITVMSIPFMAIQRYGLPIFPLLSILAFSSIIERSIRMILMGITFSLGISGILLIGL